MKRIHIFKAGRQTSSSGRAVEFSEADLVAAAAAYDPALHEAPLVVGHPASNGPAYGWVRSLSIEGGDLVAVPHQVHGDFEELVQAGRFKKVSASFYLPDAAANPKPGSYYLRHVGFLGAQAPAVKGLRPVEFAEAEEGVLVFGEVQLASQLSRLLRNIRDFFIEKHSLEEADRVLPPWAVDDLDYAAKASDQPSVMYSEPAVSEPDPAAAQAQAAVEEQQRQLEEGRAELERQRAQTEARARELEAERGQRERSDFAESLIHGRDGKGRLLPAHKAVVVGLLEQVDAAAGAAVEFGEGEKPLTVAVREWLASLPVQVDFAERAGGSGSDAEVPLDFSAPAGFVVDGSGLALHGRALAYQKEHGVDYLAAVKAVEGK